MFDLPGISELVVFGPEEPVFEQGSSVVVYEHCALIEFVDSFEVLIYFDFVDYVMASGHLLQKTYAHGFDSELVVFGPEERVFDFDLDLDFSVAQNF